MPGRYSPLDHLQKIPANATLPGTLRITNAYTSYSGVPPLDHPLDRRHVAEVAAPAEEQVRKVRICPFLTHEHALARSLSDKSRPSATNEKPVARMPDVQSAASRAATNALISSSSARRLVMMSPKAGTVPKTMFVIAR